MIARLLPLALLASPFLAHAQSTPVTCTVATLSGTHSLILNGRDASVGGGAVLSKVYLAVGTATFDGAGKVTFNLTSNTNALAGTTQTWTGTYTLPANCLGTLTTTTGDAASFTLIPFNSGKSFLLTGSDATYTITGSGSVAPVSCVTATLSGAYAFTGNGYSLNAGVINGVNTISGLLQFDGAGAISGNWLVGANGANTSSSITGHYSVTAGCTASATVTDPNGLAYSLIFTLTSADGANFGLDIASPITTFSATGHSTFTNPGISVELAAGSGLSVPPGSLFSIYGTGMSTGQAQPTSFPLPTTLAAASVTVNNEPVPLYYVDKTLINAQLPLDIQPGVATLVVKNGSTLSNAVAITIPATAQPGVFIYGANHGVIQDFPSYSLNSPSSPAKAGDTIIVYFTGGGPVVGQNTLVTGQATPTASFPVNATYSATIGGVTAEVDYVGLVPTTVGGFYQAHIVIPKIAAGDHNLILTIAGKASNATVVSTN